MKFIKSIFEGIEKLPSSSFLNWSNTKFDKKRKEKENTYKEYGGKETAHQRREVKNQIKEEISDLKGDTGVYFIQKESFQMQFFSLTFFNVRFKSPILDILNKWELDTLAAKTHFSVEDRLNRIHFVKGVDPQLRGTGLAELLYREFIHYIGWATSNADAKSGVKMIWNNIAKDPDFYTVVTYFDILAISKKREYNRDEIKIILTRFLDAKVEDLYKSSEKTEIDPELLEMFPELKEKYYHTPEVIKRYDKLIRKELDHLPFINDSLIIDNDGEEEYALIRDIYFQNKKMYYWCVIRDGHIVLRPFIEDGEIFFNKVIWKEVNGFDEYKTLKQNVDVVGIVPNIKNITKVSKPINAQDLIDGKRLTYIPKKIMYNNQEIYQLVFTRTRVKNALEIRISYAFGERLQLIKNSPYFKKIFLRK